MKYTVHVDFHKDYLRIEGDTIQVGLTSKPEKGKANRELVSKLAKYFKVPTSNVRIVRGSLQEPNL